MRAKGLVQLVIGSNGFALEDITVSAEMNELKLSMRPKMAITRKLGHTELSALQTPQVCDLARSKIFHHPIYGLKPLFRIFLSKSGAKILLSTAKIMMIRVSKKQCGQILIHIGVLHITKVFSGGDHIHIGDPSIGGPAGGIHSTGNNAAKRIKAAILGEILEVPSAQRAALDVQTGAQ